jgi:hypothetical protein
MTRLVALPLLALATPALAHPGHLAESAGHTHWLALASFGAAAAIAVIGILCVAMRRRRDAAANSE